VGQHVGGLQWPRVWRRFEAIVPQLMIKTQDNNTETDNAGGRLAS